MTTQKNLKKKIRARMEKTGESFTAARASMLGPPLPNPPAPPPPPPPIGVLGAHEEGYQCPRCDVEALVLGEEQPICRACGYTDEADSVASEYFEHVTGIDLHRTKKDTGESPIETCPECGGPLLDMGGAESPRHICFGCGTAWVDGRLSRCSDCNEWKYVPEDGGRCSDCFRELVSRDD